jgi:dTDP-4-dehydrorhamnose 3,5-epimerase
MNYKTDAVGFCTKYNGGIESWLKAQGLRHKGKKIRNNEPCALRLMPYALYLHPQPLIKMNLKQTRLPGVLIIEPQVFNDERGYFMEPYNQKRYAEYGITSIFVQDNLSYSVRGTLRGLHYQYPHEQAKLIQVLEGEVFDVVVDIRKGSPTFGQWTSSYLSSENKHQAYIPEGFAHGFCCLSETALFFYKCSDFYMPECEGGIHWSDPDLNIDWPISNPLVSEKDARNPFLKNVQKERLPI